MSIVPNSLNQINELMQGGQISSGVQFDLTDDTFAKILGNKLNQAEESGEILTQLLGPIGIPVGLNIEGLMDDPFKVAAIDSTSLGELALNQSEINGNDENILKSVGQRVDSIIDKLSGNGESVSVTDIMQMRDSKFSARAMQAQDDSSNGFGKFMKKQAANLYSTMGKTVASSIGDLLSAM